MNRQRLDHRRVFFIAKIGQYMRKFSLIEGYLKGENEFNEETLKKKKQSYIGEV
ncbi:hypothetical protein [Neobacillus sp.]|uniref:hypothetical protein n=1 Tax=Neobacillus sp. TaxID=2675273 RepID=UPI00289B5468|nr:hypothetical protein [Neobacillus sp.]